LAGTVLFVALAVAFLAFRLSLAGILACAGSLVFVVLALGSGLLGSPWMCGVSVTVPAYGQLFALSGSILAMTANIADWRWNRRRLPVST